MNALHKMDAWQWLASQPDKSIDHAVLDIEYGASVDFPELFRVVKGNVIVFDKLNRHFLYYTGDGADVTEWAQYPDKQYLWIKPSLPKNTSKQLSDPVESMYVWQRGVYRNRNDHEMQDGNMCIVRHDLIEGRQYSPWQKPLSLYRWLYELHTEPGSLVLDMFAGTGTGFESGIVTGRDVVGCETDPKMIAVIKTRIGIEPC